MGKGNYERLHLYLGNRLNFKTILWLDSLNESRKISKTIRNIIEKYANNELIEKKVVEDKMNSLVEENKKLKKQIKQIKNNKASQNKNKSKSNTTTKAITDDELNKEDEVRTKQQTTQTKKSSPHKGKKYVPAKRNMASQWKD